jgi:predicted Zn-dependent protease
MRIQEKKVILSLVSIIGAKNLFMKSTLALVISLFCLYSAGAYAHPLNYYQSTSTDWLNQTEHYHLEQGIEKAKLGQWEYAWSEYAFMLHYFPNHPRALELMADLSIQMKQTDRASKYFERAIDLYPNDATTQAMYHAFLQKIGKPGKS